MLNLSPKYHRAFIMIGFLLLSACSTGRFSALPNVMASCGFPEAKFGKFHTCMEGKVTVSKKAMQEDYYNQSSRDLLAELDDLQNKVDKKKISDKKAYYYLQQFVEQRVELEKKQAQRAAVALAIFAGVAAVGICSSNGHCGGGGGGGGGYYNTPLLCSQDPNGSPQCSIGKACGNTCIQASDTCRVGRGSACNIYPRAYP